MRGPFQFSHLLLGGTSWETNSLPTCLDTQAVGISVAGESETQAGQWGTTPRRAAVVIHVGEIERQGGQWIGGWKSGTAAGLAAIVARKRRERETGS